MGRICVTANVTVLQPSKALEEKSVQPGLMESLPVPYEPTVLPSPPPPSSLRSSSVPSCVGMNGGQSLASDNTGHSTVFCSKNEINVKDCRSHRRRLSAFLQRLEKTQQKFGVVLGRPSRV